MTIQAMPTYEQALTSHQKTHPSWYRFFQGLYKGNPPAAEANVTPGNSPYTFTTSQRGFLIVQGGTIGIISFTRNGLTNYNTGQTSGSFPLSSGDSLIITYSAAPTLTFVPQ